MNFRPIYLSLLFSIMLISSCDEDPARYRDPLLSGYVDRFIEQAAVYGQNISAEDWTVEFGQVENNLCGFASDHKVSISQECWDAMPESGREALMFHELGHALLGRSHKETLLANGDRASIMTENPTILYNAYTPIKRLYYIEELFVPSTTPPDWSLPKTNATTIFEDVIKPDNEWQFKLSGSPDHAQAISESVFSSSPSSLQITSLSTGSGYSYWTYFIVPQDVPEGTPVVVKIKIKAEGFSGSAMVTIRGDVTGDPFPAFIYTTEDKYPISGTTNGFVERTLTVPYFPNRLDKLNFYFILQGNSTGTVYFDDLEVNKYN